jgi:hypothetical protein
MLCPGCVSHGFPQAMRVASTCSSNDVCVLGLHTVFEHHNAQGTQEAVRAFLHEYKISIPVAIDAPSDEGTMPKTMAACGMQGTPTLLLIDRFGQLRKHQFGVEEDMVFGAEIMALSHETSSRTSSNTGIESSAQHNDNLR